MNQVICELAEFPIHTLFDARLNPTTSIVKGWLESLIAILVDFLLDLVCNILLKVAEEGTVNKLFQNFIVHFQLVLHEVLLFSDFLRVLNNFCAC